VGSRNFAHNGKNTQEDEMKEILGALMRAQAKFEKIEKSEKAYKYKYAPLDVVLAAVQPALQEEGLLLIHPIGVRTDGIPVVRTVLYHPETEQMMESGIPIMSIQGPQDVGSCITYFRRYTTLSLLGIIPEDEDDDGKKSQDHSERLKKKSNVKVREEKGTKSKSNSEARVVEISDPVKEKHGIEIAYEIFLEDAATQSELINWWDLNKDELNKLKSKNEKLWQKIVGKFAARKSQIEENKNAKQG